MATISRVSSASITRTSRPSSDGILPPSDSGSGATGGPAAGRASPGRRTLMGRRTVKTAPGPGSRLAAVMVPSCSSTTLRAMAMPRPSPPFPRVASPPACRNRSNTWGRNAGGMPGPVSSTVTSTCPSTAWTRTATAPPAGVNLMALLRRFHRTCCRRLGSPVTGPASASTFEVRVRPFVSAAGRTVSRAARITATGSTACISRRMVPATMREMSRRSEMRRICTRALRRIASRARADVGSSTFSSRRT